MPSTEALAEPCSDHGYNKDQQAHMLALVRYTIAQRLGLASDWAQEFAERPKASWCQQHAATFVTLMLDGQLRGCIGCLEAYQPLQEDLQQNAISAAFRDYRFPPLTQSEFRNITVEISVLTPSQALAAESEEQLLAQLRPGIDGLILQDGQFKATFLPQVWQQLPEQEEFVHRLKQKAGLAVDHWSQSMQCLVYQVQEIHE